MPSNTRTITIQVNGGRTLRVTRQEAQALGASLDDINNATGRTIQVTNQANRSMRGMTDASAAANRNFARQSQGLGGLVRVYATVAANIFAVSSAFNILRNAADFKILQDSAEEFSVQSGVNFNRLAGSLKEVTKGALDFKTALQLANLGTAGGLTGDQLQNITEVATKAAGALGRNIPEAVNRLTQAVIKGEPELADEFGIIIRLEEANREYAKSIGKTVKSLNTLERVQAVVNQVITQGEQKYGKQTIKVNEFQRALTKVTEVGRDVLIAISGPFEGVAKVIADNTELVVVGISALIATIATLLIPELTKGITMLTRFSQAMLATATATATTNNVLGGSIIKNLSLLNRGLIGSLTAGFSGSGSIARRISVANRFVQRDLRESSALVRAFGAIVGTAGGAIGGLTGKLVTGLRVLGPWGAGLAAIGATIFGLLRSTGLLTGSTSRLIDEIEEQDKALDLANKQLDTYKENLFLIINAQNQGNKSLELFAQNQKLAGNAIRGLGDNISKISDEFGNLRRNQTNFDVFIDNLIDATIRFSTVALDTFRNFFRDLEQLLDDNKGLLSFIPFIGSFQKGVGAIGKGLEFLQTGSDLATTVSDRAIRETTNSATDQIRTAANFFKTATGGIAELSNLGFDENRLRSINLILSNNADLANFQLKQNSGWFLLDEILKSGKLRAFELEEILKLVGKTIKTQGAAPFLELSEAVAKFTTAGKDAGEILDKLTKLDTNSTSAKLFETLAESFKAIDEIAKESKTNPLEAIPESLQKLAGISGTKGNTEADIKRAKDFLKELELDTLEEIRRQRQLAEIKKNTLIIEKQESLNILGTRTKLNRLAAQESAIKIQQLQAERKIQSDIVRTSGTPLDSADRLAQANAKLKIKKIDEQISEESIKQNFLSDVILNNLLEQNKTIGSTLELKKIEQGILKKQESTALSILKSEVSSFKNREDSYKDLISNIESQFDLAVEVNSEEKKRLTNLKRQEERKARLLGLDVENSREVKKINEQLSESQAKLDQERESRIKKLIAAIKSNPRVTQLEESIQKNKLLLAQEQQKLDFLNKEASTIKTISNLETTSAKESLNLINKRLDFVSEIFNQNKVVLVQNIKTLEIEKEKLQVTKELLEAQFTSAELVERNTKIEEKTLEILKAKRDLALLERDSALEVQEVLLAQQEKRFQTAEFGDDAFAETLDNAFGKIARDFKKEMMSAAKFTTTLLVGTFDTAIDSITQAFADGSLTIKEAVMQSLKTTFEFIKETTLKFVNDQVKESFRDLLKETFNIGVTPLEDNTDKIVLLTQSIDNLTTAITGRPDATNLLSTEGPGDVGSTILSLGKSLIGSFGGGDVGSLTSTLTGSGGLFGAGGGMNIGLGSTLQSVSNPLTTAFPFDALLPFANGGISDRPAIFGESGPEAAVPLPDGKSIPVTLNKGASSNNVSVIVNVDAENGSVTTQSQGTDAEESERFEKVGNMIGAAVRNELVEQMRPGGLLS